MEHSHVHSHAHVHGAKNLCMALIINICFLIIEVLGGLFTNSTAILSDAVHDLSDCLALALSAIVRKCSNKKATEFFTYGLKRLSVVGAFFNIIVLSVGIYFVICESITNIITPQPVKSNGMLIIAIVGIFANALAAFVVNGSQNILDKTVSVHLMQDCLGWIAVVVVSIVMIFTQWYILDPILSLCIAIYIIKNTYVNLKKSVLIIMQSIPDKKSYTDIKDLIISNDEVDKLIESHFWSLDGENNVFTAKIKLVNGTNERVVLNDIKKILSDNQIENSTIEFVHS